MTFTRETKNFVTVRDAGMSKYRFIFTLSLQIVWGFLETALNESVAQP